MDNQKKSATQRLSELETAFMSLYGAADNMARDLMVIKEAIKLLGNKVDAMVKCLNKGKGLSDENIAAEMVENNVQELKSRVDNMLGQGVLVATDTVVDNTFVVGRELGDDGKIVNPRIQFLLSAVKPELQDKLKGAKVGDKVDTGEGKMPLEVLEVYTIATPKAPEQDELEGDQPESNA
jgi:hypothetical protein